MPTSKLIEIVPGKGLDVGVFPSAEDTARSFGWVDARNAWFRDLHIEHMPGQRKIEKIISRQPKALAQAYVNGVKRLFYEDGGIISYIDTGVGPPVVIGTLNSFSQSYWLEPWGEYLIASDNISQLQLWAGSGTFIPIAGSQFQTAKIVKKLAQHVLAYSTNVFPNGFHWCSASNVMEWAPTTTNSARNIPIRNLDSDINAVADLNGGHAVYSSAYMLQVSYLGPSDWFGTPAAPLSGIGAGSRYAVVSLGRYNWGLCRSGVFLTDGQTFMYVDRPAIDRWVQEEIDWSREKEIVGFFDEKLLLILWSVPLLAGGKSVIAVDPKDRTLLTDRSKRPFTFATGDYGAALRREVLDYPVVAREDGIYFTSVNGTTMEDFFLSGGLFDAGDHSVNKTWELAKFEGLITGAEVRFGFTDLPYLESVEWQDWSLIEFEFPLPGGPRESIYIAMEIKSAFPLRLSGFTMWGQGAGKAT
jgi:hypothetical protein